MNPLKEIRHPKNPDYVLILLPSETMGIRYCFSDGWRTDYPIHYGKAFKDGKQTGWDNPEYFPKAMVRWANSTIITIEQIFNQ